MSAAMVIFTSSADALLPEQPPPRIVADFPWGDEKAAAAPFGLRAGVGRVPPRPLLSWPVCALGAARRDGRASHQRDGRLCAAAQGPSARQSGPSQAANRWGWSAGNARKHARRRGGLLRCKIKLAT